MSRTFEIACKDCCEALWIGQGWPDTTGVYLYKSELYIKALEKFLFEHEGHRLIFSDSEKFDFDELTSYDEKEYLSKPPENYKSQGNKLIKIK